MLRRTALAGLLAAPWLRAQQAAREVLFEQGQFRWPTIPGFHGSRLYFRDQGRHNRVTLYPPGGGEEVIFDTPPEAGRLPEVLTLAIDSDGVVAVGWMSGGPNAAAGIDYHDAAGKLIRSIDTGRYIAAHLAFAADHSLWSFGWQRDRFEPRKPEFDEYMMVRRFELDWGQIGAYTPRSTFAAGSEPGNPYWQRRQIAVAADRIGVLAHPPARSPKREWVELDFEGKLTGRWPVALAVDRMAFTQDARVYLESGENEKRVVARLNRSTGAWDAIAKPPPGILCGAEGNQLVFADWVQGRLHFRWYDEL